MTDATLAERPTRPLPHRTAVRPALVLVALAGLLVAVALVATTIGAAGIPFHRLVAVLGLADGDVTTLARDRLVLGSVRLPRIALAAMVGGMLALSGTIMQGLFRNPLADPALVGVSGGAALAAAAVIVVGDRIAATWFGAGVPLAALPLAAFVGALISTVALYRIATREGRTSIAMFLLGGLAIGALANAATGLLIYVANDTQLRDFTFWMLGSLGGATWHKVAAIAPFLAVAVAAMPFIARGLDLLVLGETEAFHGGIDTERLKRVAVVLVAAAAGAAVSVSGVVGFVGIVVPHLLRLAVGPGHRLLLPASLLLGAALLVGADTVARVTVAPAELPIGIVTAALGAPFFLALLMRQRSLLGP